jgi:hypothetical protein
MKEKDQRQGSDQPEQITGLEDVVGLTEQPSEIPDQTSQAKDAPEHPLSS